MCDAWGAECNRTGDPGYCLPVSTSAVANAYQAAWTGATQAYDNGVCPLDEDAAGCDRYAALESPKTGMVATYLSLRGAGPAVFTCAPGLPGTSIVDLSDPSANYDRLIQCITEVNDTVTAEADPEGTYGCDGTVIMRGMGMVQGETDDIDPPNTSYASQIASFISGLQTDVEAITGQTSPIEVVWYQTSGWSANGTFRAPTAQRLLDAADAIPQLHVMEPVGYYNDQVPDDDTTDIVTWETDGVSPLHYSALAHYKTGSSMGKWLYRAIHEGANWNGLRYTSVTQSGSTLTACFNLYAGTSLVRDTTTCPVHWNGADGFAWYQDEIGAPSITSVTQNGSCLEFTMSAPVTDVASGRLEAGFQGLSRLSQDPPNGCRLAADGAVNPGTPGWTQYRDNDSVGSAVDYGLPSWNYVATQSRAVDTGAVPAPTEDAVAYIDGDDATEHISFPDNPLFAGATALTVSFWARFAELASGQILVAQGTAFQVRAAVSGTNFRLLAYFNGASDRSETLTYFIPQDASTWRHVVFRYDGSQPLTSRVQWTVDRINYPDNEIGTIPTSITDSAANLTIGAASGGAFQDIRDVAIWDRALTDAEVLTLRTQSSAGALALAPEYFVRPVCSDDLSGTSGGVFNFGSSGDDGTGQDMEADDRVVDDTPACEALDGGVADTGVADSGADAGADAGASDAGFPATVPNARSLTLDGTGDYVHLANPQWLDGDVNALVCYLIQEPTTQTNDTVLGVWQLNDYQFRVYSRTSDQWWYAPAADTAANGIIASAPSSPSNGLQPVVPGPWSHICVRFQLGEAVSSDRMIVYANGTSVPLTQVSTPGTAFTTPGGGGFAIGAQFDGTEPWAGNIDEVWIWDEDNGAIPDATQIANEILIDARDWQCVLPNPGLGGFATARAPDIKCRFEADYLCTDPDGATVATLTNEGDATFSTERACAELGSRQNYTSLSAVTTDHWETDSWIQSGDENMVVCWTQLGNPTLTNNTIMAQHDLDGTLEDGDSWAINARLTGLRIYKENASNGATLDYYDDSTGPMANGVWSNWCVLFEGSNAPRAWHNCSEPLTFTPSGAGAPVQFRYDASAVTTIAGPTGGGSSGWGGTGYYIRDVVVWREQDGNPDATEIANTVCYDASSDPPPDYTALAGIDQPGCWFTMDGVLYDRMGNCADLTAGGASAITWPTSGQVP